MIGTGETLGPELLSLVGLDSVRHTPQEPEGVKEWCLRDGDSRSINAKHVDSWQGWSSRFCATLVIVLCNTSDSNVVDEPTIMLFIWRTHRTARE